VLQIRVLFLRTVAPYCLWSVLPESTDHIFAENPTFFRGILGCIMYFIPIDLLICSLGIFNLEVFNEVEEYIGCVN